MNYIFGPAALLYGIGRKDMIMLTAPRGWNYDRALERTCIAANVCSHNIVAAIPNTLPIGIKQQSAAYGVANTCGRFNR